MHRFYKEDPENEKPFFKSEYDDDDDDDMDDFDDMDEDSIEFLHGPDFYQVMQVGRGDAELKHHLLDKAIEIAQNSWFWRFKSIKSKMSQIDFIYKSLQLLTADIENNQNDDSKTS